MAHMVHYQDNPTQRNAMLPKISQHSLPRSYRVALFCVWTAVTVRVIRANLLVQQAWCHLYIIPGTIGRQVSRLANTLMVKPTMHICRCTFRTPWPWSSRKKSFVGMNLLQKFYFLQHKFRHWWSCIVREVCATVRWPTQQSVSSDAVSNIDVLHRSELRRTGDHFPPSLHRAPPGR